jgi:hypothetical protein
MYSRIMMMMVMIMMMVTMMRIMKTLEANALHRCDEEDVFEDYARFSCRVVELYQRCQCHRLRPSHVKDQLVEIGCRQLMWVCGRSGCVCGNGSGARVPHPIPNIHTHTHTHAYTHTTVHTRIDTHPPFTTSWLRLGEARMAIVGEKTNLAECGTMAYTARRTTPCT